MSRAALLLVLGLSTAAAAGPPSMLVYLARVAESADPVANIYLNGERARGMQTLLARPMSRAEEIKLRLRIATELVQAGQTRAAIAEAERVHRLIGDSGQPGAAAYHHMLRDLVGIAWLRLGEQENCLRNHTTSSCLLPIHGDGVHTLPEGSRKAVDQYLANLEEQPADLATRWLLNLAYMTLGEYPRGVPRRWLIPDSVFASEHDVGRFRDVAPQAGLATVGRSGGSIAEDLDGDGLLDVVASSWGLRDQLRCFANRGDGTFVERTALAGLEGQLGGLNLTHADYDNDGHRDLLVLRGAWMGEEGRHPNSLLRNRGDGTFADVTVQAGLFSLHPTHSAAFSDYDNDGWLDLFVANESSPGHPHRCQLYHNDGDGTFSEVAATAGVAHVGFVKGVAWGDYDNDGRQDLYLSQFLEDNALYHNEGRGADGSWRFARVPGAAGAVGPRISFPTWFWDYDNDGWLDLFAGGFGFTELGDLARIYLGQPFTADHARLYRNRGDGTFADVTSQVGGLDRVILAMGAGFGDLDNDGWLDCYIGTGAPDLRTLTPNRMLRNDAGRHFQDVTTSGGFGNVQKGHGVSFADFDNDGDQDVFQVMGGAFEGDVYQNVLYENPGHGNHWLTLSLEGRRSNRDAIGARVRVHLRRPGGEERDVYVTVGTGGSFGSTSLQQEIGLGDALAIDHVEITWPATGTRQRLEGLALDGDYRVREGHLPPERLARRTFDLSPGEEDDTPPALHH